MNGKVVCNTGPIIAFSMINRLDILRGLFKIVKVPKSVHVELMESGPNNTGLAGYRKADWIKVEKVTNPIDPLLTTALDFGEAEVIGLARQVGVTCVLIDERKA